MGVLLLLPPMVAADIGVKARRRGAVTRRRRRVSLDPAADRGGGSMRRTPMARFENLIVWQKAQDLAVAADAIASRLRYDAADQLRRSTASTADNIAEG